MKTFLLHLTRPTLQRYLWQDALLWIPRIYCGYYLAFNFGAAKFGLPWSPPENNLGFFEVAFWFPNDINEYGGVFSLCPALLAWLGAFSEAVGGLALILGFQTRIFSFLIAVTMLVAAFVQHAGEELWQQLPAMHFFWVALYCMILGSGRFGIDYLLTKNKTL